MRVFLVGEASTHRDDLTAGMDTHLRDRIEIVDLPREAAHDSVHDHLIAPDDIVVSLRMNRGGAPLPRMRMLHVPGAGLDGIDLKALDPDVVLCNVFEHEIPIAEFTLASMLEWEIDLAGMKRGFTPETWPDIYRERVPHGEIHGKVLLVLGYGRIGQAVAARAAAFGMVVLAVDPMLADKADPQNVAAEIAPPARLAELAARADYLVVTCPLTESSRGSIGRTVLKALGSEGVVINVSRAEIVDEDDLYVALTAGTIRGANLDVWYRYPKGSDDRVTPSQHDFHALPNVRATPHSSAWTRELSHRRYAVIAANIAALIRGEPLRNQVRTAR
ncbi:NAD(P)-dependent oxidoreductase [Billgrantia endophytica]|uniref:D-isomer specific 2-hydroxyacid dehydrogenase NAD-binding domain-containing protein n=1 Tax=Billgrantia endophytica TaxID=2033802 RepID=A0A2N7U2V9_9GAMM|nr:NAD(P)-dependent oxidoreductase [Halomonas endophytica]PMR74774.1 hypothetical protein C1H69_13060 [Halomonas endophytica]